MQYLQHMYDDLHDEQSHGDGHIQNKHPQRARLTLLWARRYGNAPFDRVDWVRGDQCMVQANWVSNQ